MFDISEEIVEIRLAYYGIAVLLLEQAMKPANKSSSSQGSGAISS
jgi:hypothetical protein